MVVFLVVLDWVTLLTNVQCVVDVNGQVAGEVSQGLLELALSVIEEPNDCILSLLDGISDIFNLIDCLVHRIESFID